jgi:hypothetical protein
MDSLGNLARVEGFKSNLAINGKLVTLTTGEKFTALIYEAPDLEAQSLLGEDIREGDWVDVLRSDAPARLMAPEAESQVDATVDGVKIRLLKRRDNVANPVVKFQVTKVLGVDS